MKKIASLTLAVLLACALACPALAAGGGALYPAEIVESTEGGYSRLEKIYHLTANVRDAIFFIVAYLLFIF